VPTCTAIASDLLTKLTDKIFSSVNYVTHLLNFLCL
jgi:hypothetical protein